MDTHGEEVLGCDNRGKQVHCLERKIGSTQRHLMDARAEHGL